jgi:hypothetical protein
MKRGVIMSRTGEVLPPAESERWSRATKRNITYAQLRIEMHARITMQCSTPSGNRPRLFLDQLR